MSIKASADYDEKALDAKIASLTAMTTEQVQPISSMPVFDGEKFVPGDITEGTAIDADALKKAVVQAIEGLQEQLDLDEAGCYVQPLYKGVIGSSAGVRCDECIPECECNL